MADIGETVRFYQRIHNSGRAEVDFLEFTRSVERASGERAVGKSVGRHLEPVRFGQVPHLNYASTSVAGIVEREKTHVLVNFLGLWGPNGPMPLAASEYVFNRSHNCYDQTLRRFADIIHHRFIGLYYRAWKANEQAIGFDKKNGGLIARTCDALAGWSASGSSLPQYASCAFGSAFGSAVKSRDGLSMILNGALGLPVRIVERIESSAAIPVDSRGRLGVRGVSELGRSVQLGSRFRTCTRKFVVQSEVVDYARAAKFFPGLKGGRMLVDFVQSYLDRPLEWDLRLELRTDSLPPPLVSGVRQLGQSLWLGRPKGETTEVVLGMSRLAETQHVRKRSVRTVQDATGT